GHDGHGERHDESPARPQQERRGERGGGDELQVRGRTEVGADEAPHHSECRERHDERRAPPAQRRALRARHEVKVSSFHVISSPSSVSRDPAPTVASSSLTYSAQNSLSGSAATPSIAVTNAFSPSPVTWADGSASSSRSSAVVPARPS